jgi:hypothetical protein
MKSTAPSFIARGERDVAVPGDDNRREVQCSFVEVLLQFETGHSRHPHIDDQAAAR